jgi:hypothetical protein
VGVSQADAITTASAPTVASGSRHRGARGLEKKLTQELKRIQAEYPDADVEVWCEDEHRIGLQPVSRRIWVEEGNQSPRSMETRVAMAVWLCSTSDGETYWWVLKRSRRTEYSARRTRARMSTPSCLVES